MKKSAAANGLVQVLYVASNDVRADAASVATVAAPPPAAAAEPAAAVVPPPAAAPVRASRPALRVKRGFMVDVRAAAKSHRRLELLIGVVFAGFVPLAVFETAHAAIPSVLADAATYGDWTQAFVAVLALVVLGGLGYSAPTVYAVGMEAFGGKKVKAAGFTLLVEGVMTVVPIPWLRIVALLLLIAINAVGTACSLARSVRVVDADDVEV